MILIIHGDDIVSSRNYFLELRKKAQNPLLFDGKNLELSDLSISLENKSLFFDKRDIFIENLLSSKNSELKDIFGYFEKNKNHFNVTFWEPVELEKSKLQLIKTANVKLFKLPQKLFYFLDNIKPSNQNNVLLFHEVLKTTDPEIIFYMMVRQFRLLLVLFDSKKDTIDEVKRLLPWQESKLRRQAGLFNLSELKKIYKKLYEIDLGIKSGTTLSLQTSIDFLLLDI